MRITVIVSDATHAVHVGGEVERVARTFDMPQEMADWITAEAVGSYASVSLAIDKEPPHDRRD